MSVRMPYENSMQPTPQECEAVGRALLQQAWPRGEPRLPGPLSGDGASAYGRGPSPINWSVGPIFVAPKTYLGVTIADARVVSVLKVEGTGIPRYWTVQGSASLEFGGPTAGSTFTSVEHSMRIRWTVGRASYVADFDIPAGGWCFGINADSMELLAVNNDVTWPFEVVATVGPAQPTDDYRTPRRTVRLATPANTLVDYPVPRFSQQVQMFKTAASATQVCQWRDAVGNVIADFVTPSQAAAGLYTIVLDVPASAAVLRFAALAGTSGIGALVFRLGF